MQVQAYDLRRAAAYCLTFGMLVLGCTDSHPGAPNGQTHWLRECKGSAECGKLLCICGVCSAACDNGESCEAAVGEAAACKAAASASKKGQCPAAVAEKKICVAECSKDAECTDRSADLRCASGICSLSDVSPSIADARPPDSGASADAGGDGKSDGGGTNEPASSEAPKELTCKDGEPGHVPDGVAVIAADLSSQVEWTVSKDVLTWAVGPNVVLWRQALEDGNPISAPSSVVTDAVDDRGMAIAAYGSDTLVATLNASGNPPAVALTLRLVPETGPALNIAKQSASGGALRMVLDADSAYWLGSTNSSGMGALLRAPRTPGASVSLGATANSVYGPIVVAGFLYVATVASGKSQVLRAAIDGSSPLAALGPELNLVDDLTTDGTDLLLMLDPEFDQLDNPSTPGRIVRMTPEGIVTDVTTMEETRPNGWLAVASDALYWSANHFMNNNAWSGTLWSAPADGSSARVKALTSPNARFGGLVSNQGDLYFALVCRTETGDDRMHIMRLRP